MAESSPRASPTQPPDAIQPGGWCSCSSWRRPSGFHEFGTTPDLRHSSAAGRDGRRSVSDGPPHTMSPTLPLRVRAAADGPGRPLLQHALRVAVLRVGRTVSTHARRDTLMLFDGSALLTFVRRRYKSWPICPAADSSPGSANPSELKPWSRPEPRHRHEAWVRVVVRLGGLAVIRAGAGLSSLS